MATLSNLADLVSVRNHLRMLLDSQYRKISRDEDKALGKLIGDLDQLFLNTMIAHAANPGAILDPYEGPEPEEIIAALKKSAIAVPGEISVVNEPEAQSKQLELGFEQKEKVKRGRRKVKANKDKEAKKLKNTIDAETREMNDKIAQAKKEVAGRPKAKAIEPKGDGTSNES